MAEDWKITGGYFEACNCDSACPCVFLGPPTQGDCTLVVAWHIEKGHLGAIALDGLNVALAAYSPGHMLETKWEVALYLDERGSPEQRDALLTIFSGQAGGHLANLAACLGKLLGVKAAAIDFHAEGKRRRMKIGSSVEMAVEAVRGAGGAEVTIANLPFCVVPEIPAVAAKSQRLSYHDFGRDWEITDGNGFYSAFAYQG
jgi:hypothetical protein